MPGRVAHGVGDDLIARSADVCLKERRKLLLVTREMPLSRIHLQNMLLVTEAGGMICPASPHFYHQPANLQSIADTVVDRLLDHLGVEVMTHRWKEEA